ncbi:helix-turn-helix transcriptional regulator [Nocardioides sp. STR2]|uniref:Helix-turn-helix transcriptional regulator n=1 Tax=Nocardioides pini TaxID=2975053 RepID=A0ABT4CAZ6_9ACTN|nr:helix-turn-helix transcriptional regulator [Nocardioides pini]MCY4726135.1 helix-turn-helix transcriptional regulator [Nocardioides pini]
MSGTTTVVRTSGLTDDELDWLHMGPFDGGVGGLVRRVRRILDVSQRGLAELLGVSQSAVARWETERTSPRVSVLQQMLRLRGSWSPSTTRSRASASSRCAPTAPAGATGAATPPTWT